MQGLPSLIHCDAPHKTGNRTLHEKLILIDYETVIFGSHNLAWSNLSRTCELSVYIKDEDLSRQAATPHLVRLEAGPHPDQLPRPAP